MNNEELINKARKMVTPMTVGLPKNLQDQKADEIDEVLSTARVFEHSWFGHDKMITKHRSELKQQLLALKERWTREARIDELDKVNYKYFLRGSSWVKYFNNRIAQLGGKE